MNPEERKAILSGKKAPQRGAKPRASNGKNVDAEGDAAKRQPATWQEVAISWVKTILGALVIVMIVNGLFIQSFVVPTESMENEVLAGDFVFVNRFIYGGSTPQTIPFLNVPLPYLSLPGFRDPERNDVIVFIYPGNRDEVEAADFQYYLKRCVAVAGDTLEVRDGYAYVNGVKETFPENGMFAKVGYEQSYDEQRTFPRGRKFTRDSWGPMRIPKEGDAIAVDQTDPKGWVEQWGTFIEREGHQVRLDGQIVNIDDKPVTSYTVERDYVFGMGDNRNNSLDSRYFGFVPEENVVGTPLIVYWSWQPYEIIYDPYGNQVDKNYYSIFQRLGHIRWNRIFNTID